METQIIQVPLYPFWTPLVSPCVPSHLAPCLNQHPRIAGQKESLANPMVAAVPSWLSKAWPMAWCEQFRFCNHLSVTSGALACRIESVLWFNVPLVQWNTSTSEPSSIGPVFQFVGARGGGSAISFPTATCYCSRHPNHRPAVVSQL